LALIAVALAHIKERGPKAARAFGTGDPPALSPLRFNTLIRATTPAALWRPLTRALAVIKGAASPGELAADLFYWNEQTRTRWCFDYYGETTAAPMKLETET
jgi:CRISPR system Cascade subunit CasB